MQEASFVALLIDSMLLTSYMLSSHAGKGRKGKKLRKLNKLRSKFWRDVYAKQLEAGTSKPCMLILA